MKNDPILAALARLDDISPHTSEGREALAKALAAKSNLVVAKAARIAGDLLMAELSGGLVKAFDRLLPRGASGDKGCAALTAIARALFALDHDDYEPFLAGIKHVQMEASFGPPVDTAVELRAVCAMGLNNTHYRYKLRALVELLADKEWQARAGAIRALATAGSESAALILRFKALTGDQETEVMSECFSALLGVEGVEALPLVREFAMSRDAELCEAALLALGASRRPEAIEWLIRRFHEVASREAKKQILLSLAASRTETAIEFLIQIVRDESEQVSVAAVDAMNIHRDEQLRERVQQALQTRA